MTLLLDVNVLLALCYESHVHHQRASQWLRRLRSRHDVDLVLASCAITELGFVRIETGGGGFSSHVSNACSDLKRLKTEAPLCFLSDELSAECLPVWVTKSKQTTNGHLLQLASACGATLATLDTGIPSSLLIPELPQSANEVREPPVAYGVAA